MRCGDFHLSCRSQESNPGPPTWQAEYATVFPLSRSLRVQSAGAGHAHSLASRPHPPPQAGPSVRPWLPGPTPTCGHSRAEFARQRGRRRLSFASGLLHSHDVAGVAPLAAALVPFRLRLPCSLSVQPSGVAASTAAASAAVSACSTPPCASSGAGSPLRRFCARRPEAPPACSAAAALSVPQRGRLVQQPRQRRPSASKGRCPGRDAASLVLLICVSVDVG